MLNRVAGVLAAVTNLLSSGKTTAREEVVLKISRAGTGSERGEGWEGMEGWRVRW